MSSIQATTGPTVVCVGSAPSRLTRGFCLHLGAMLSPPVQHHHLNRRQWLASGLGALLAGCQSTEPHTPGTKSASHNSRAPRVRLIGHTRITAGQHHRRTLVGGLSGLDYDPAGRRWLSLSDDRSDLQPARFYSFELPLSRHAIGRPTLNGMTSLTRADGSPYPSQATDPQQFVDPEALRWRPDTQTVLWTSEGHARYRRPPAIHESTASGQWLRAFTLPEHFDEFGPTRGPHYNQTFEGLALSPDGQQLWASMEGPLKQDDPRPRPGEAQGSCRITQFDLALGKPLRQFAYQPDPVPHGSLWPGGYAETGISEILCLDAHQLLVLERTYILGWGHRIRLYRCDHRQGTNTLTLPTLSPQNHAPTPKTLVLDFADLDLPHLDNLEGMAWGPTLPGQPPGTRTLVLVSDDNFNPFQVTQLIALELQENLT